MSSRRLPSAGGPGSVDFSQSPFLVIWETTQACDLACRHCRAEAVAERHRDELSTDEAKDLLRSVRRFGKPLFILTGGDPVKRPDTLELVRFGTSIGLRMAMTPSGTPLVTSKVVQELAEAGLARLAVSLDGSTREIHDAFRGVSGSWDLTLGILRSAREAGLSTQVNTTVAPHNLSDFDNIARLVAELDIALWSVFFVVPTGRANVNEVGSAEDFETIFNKMYELSTTATFDIKSTAAPQYRRVVLQHEARKRRTARDYVEAEPAAAVVSLAPDRASGLGTLGRARGVNDGDGLVFVSHLGEIFPSGFLPISAGNVRRDDLVAVYRESPLFRQLRDSELLKGKCRVCAFRAVCGGSRAHAFAMTGDYLESEPCCAYVPKAGLIVETIAAN